MSDNRQTELRLGPKGRAVFTVAGWNKALRDAGIYAGNWWIANYGPLRWNVGYPQSQLGYRPGKSKRKDLARGGKPFFDRGTMQANFNSRARTEAVAKKGGARFWIVCPVGHALRPETAAAFKTIPPGERKAVSREYRRAIIQALQAQRIVAAGKAQAQAERASRAAANKAKRQAQRERAAANRKARIAANEATARSRNRRAERIAANRAQREANRTARMRASIATQNARARRAERAYIRKVDRQIRNNERARSNPNNE
jgi:hypothetical protein